MKPPRTSQQPQRTVLRRYREGGITMAVLECGHDEPATGLDMATSLRCLQCNPVRREDAPPKPVGHPWLR